ncbi:ADP-ribose glycohydrolase MACROD1 isoform X4 [Urocitellus parryii]
MSLLSRVSRRLAQLRAAGQLLVASRPRPGPSGPTRTRSSAYGPPASLGAHGPRARTSAGVGAWGAAAVGRRPGVRTWAPLAMAAKVDLSTSTDWKEAKSFLKGLSDKQREEHYFCRDFIRLKKIPTWKETAKGVAAKVEEPKFKKDKQLNEKISLFRGDITKLEVDAIVNAAWPSLWSKMADSSRYRGTPGPRSWTGCIKGGRDHTMEVISTPPPPCLHPGHIKQEHCGVLGSTRCRLARGVLRLCSVCARRRKHPGQRRTATWERATLGAAREPAPGHPACTASLGLIFIPNLQMTSLRLLGVVGVF